MLLNEHVINNLKFNSIRGLDSKRDYTKETVEKLYELIKILDNFKCKKHNWTFWIKVLKGNMNDFEYELYDDWDNDIFKDESERLKDWNEEYPDEEYYHHICVYYENYQDCDYIYILIDDRTVIAYKQKENRETFAYDESDTISYIIDCVNNIRGLIDNNQYDDFINHIPHKYLDGLIPRKILYELSPNIKEDDYSNISKEEIEEFIHYCGSNNVLTPIKMNYHTYCKIVKECYLSIGADVCNMDEYLVYKKHVDDRDGGMSLLDPDNYDEFDKWYHLSDEEKWKIENPSHMFEIIQGHTHTRVHLFIKEIKDNNYVLKLSGGKHTLRNVIVKMYLHLIRLGYPVDLYEKEEYLNAYKELDNYGIVSKFDDIYDIWYDSFYGNYLLDYIHLEDVNNQEEVIKNTKWFKLDKLELKERDKENE